MASYHLSVKTGGKGSASPHADYIAREGKYSREKDTDLEHKESGNMPAWAAHKPSEFMVRKLNRPLLGFLTMNCGKEEPQMVRAVAE